jgi:hypothetical protein
MRRRTLFVVLAGLAVVIAAGAVVLWTTGEIALWPRADRITRGDFDRISAGMSRAQVEAILGPPGDYTTGPIGFHDWQMVGWPDRSSKRRPGVMSGYGWTNDLAHIWVEFGDSGEVVAAAFWPCSRPKQGIVELVLSWANRQWHRWFP